MGNREYLESEGKEGKSDSDSDCSSDGKEGKRN